MADKLTRRDFFKGAIILVSGSVVATVAYLFDRSLRQTTVTQPTRTPGAIAVADQPAEPTATDVSVVEQRPTPTEISAAEQSQIVTVTRSPNHSDSTSAIIADHTIVDKYQNIPDEYKLKVKKMFVNIPGESHSGAYFIGCQLLASLDNSFRVNITNKASPENYTDEYLRMSPLTWGDIDHKSGWIRGYGEEDWFTSELAMQRTKAHIDYCNSHDLVIAAIGFGWCWDMSRNPNGGMHPEYKMRWAGSSIGGPDGDRSWGLDADDYLLTQNRVCMDTYLHVTQDYMDHCEFHNYPTKVFFTTGPVDSPPNIGEAGYQREIKHEYMREFVKNDNKRILFDYADILCWNDNNQQNNIDWLDSEGTNHTFPFIHDDNLLTMDGSFSDGVGHIGERGALRLAKALWWMLARMAGWEGV